MAEEHEEITRSAKLRAAVNAFMLQRPGHELTQAQIEEAHAELFKELKYSKNAVYAVLQSMVKNDMLDVRNDNDNNVNYYSAKGTTRIVQADAVMLKPVKPAKPARPAPEIIVDVIKETGRVRITTQGVVIELGVVEK